MAMMFRGAPATPDVRIAIQNRLMVLAYAGWILTVARSAQRLARSHTRSQTP